MSRPHTLIFDLDGTLIDSSKSILIGFAGAFAAEGISPQVALDASIIGPPLKETLAILAGTHEPALIARLTDAFKAIYDTTGYRETTVFPGVHEMLMKLRDDGYPLHIATNKRLHPTQKILDHLGWRDLFGEVRALDAWTPPATNKAAMIARLLEETGLNAVQCLYIGDRNEDARAAAANAMPFAFAAWGYGGVPVEVELPPLSSPQQLVALVNT